MRFIHLIVILILVCGCTSQTQEKAEEGSLPVTARPYLDQDPPGLEPKIFAPGVVTSEDRMEHASITVSPDLSEIYWGSIGKGILYSRLENGSWTDALPAGFALDRDGEPMFARDGRKLFFLSWRQLEGDKEQDENIWYVERDGGDWSKPRPLDMMINGGQLHWQFSVGEDGTLYFASNRPGTVGNDDIFISKMENGRYLEPENAGEAINSGNHETCPFIAYDNSYLLFAAMDRQDGYGLLDIYISFRNEDGSWSKAINIGAPVNTGSMETAPYISPDGKYLFYSSHATGEGDVYWVSALVIEELRARAIGR
jgi:hypothetical protein